MVDRVEFKTSDEEHLAFMTLEDVVPEEGEDSFKWPSFTDVVAPEGYGDPPAVEEWLLECVGGVEVLNEEGMPLTWDDPEYLDFMMKEFRPGALVAVPA